MGEFLATPVRQLSLGQRMRGDFAAAMLHDPQVVFLDEPTIGLDVVAKEAIRTFIADVNRERGTTFILTTHDLADVERLCRRIVLIDRRHADLRRRDRDAARRATERTARWSSSCASRSTTSRWTAPRPSLRRPTIARFRFDRRTMSAEALIRARHRALLR